jgi:3-hydroxy acid dehydrogenase/malonic semialdehyde reductase
VGEGDQGDVENLGRLVQEAEAALGGLDALIVNAGVGASSVTKMNHEDWDHAMNVNLLGPMHLAALAAPHIEASGGGHIIFLGSMSSKTRSEGGDVYVASKLGLHGFVDSFGRGVAKSNVNACLIEPGLVLTDMTSENHSDHEEMIVRGDMLIADDIARVVLFILAQPPRVCLPLVQVRPRMQLI